MMTHMSHFHFNYLFGFSVHKLAASVFYARDARALNATNYYHTLT